MSGTYTYQDGYELGLKEGKAEADETLAAAVRAVWGAKYGMMNAVYYGVVCRGNCELFWDTKEYQWKHAADCKLLAGARALGLEGAG